MVGTVSSVVPVALLGIQDPIRPEVRPPGSFSYVVVLFGGVLLRFSQKGGGDRLSAFTQKLYLWFFLGRDLYFSYTQRFALSVK